ncbi:hypothetical protein P3T43_004926 [Paraburkholderia sp. GAS41]|jgi:hypothetical protein|uniref:hypothetical protein n=1 Tax=Paraburkholderia sp. GAS41 TaxID=3035134 RepID=UPI003D256B1F
MKVLKMVLIACSLSAVAVAAQAQTAAPVGDVQQVAQDQQQYHAQPSRDAAQKDRAAVRAKRAAECVGPVSFCNVFFGS